jgi:hypothetical protein
MEAIVLAALLVVAQAGCATRSRHVASSGQPPVAEEDEARVPERAGARGGQEAVRLPGQDRWLPSEDPRNRPASGGRTTIIMPEAMTIGPPSSADAPAPAAGPQGAPAPVTAPQDATTPERADAPYYAVQVLASTTELRARSLRDELTKALGIPVAVDAEGGIWKVRLGHEAQREAAEELRRRMAGLGYEDAFVVYRGSR